MIIAITAIARKNMPRRVVHVVSPVSPSLASEVRPPCWSGLAGSVTHTLRTVCEGSKSSFIATALVGRRQKINPDIRPVAVTRAGQNDKARVRRLISMAIKFGRPIESRDTPTRPDVSAPPTAGQQPTRQRGHRKDA